MHKGGGHRRARATKTLSARGDAASCLGAQADCGHHLNQQGEVTLG